MQRNDVAGRKHLLHRFGLFNFIGGSELFRPVQIVADHVEPKSLRTRCDFFSNSSQTNDTDGLTHDLVPSHSFPLAGAHDVDLINEVAKQTQHQHERMLGDGRVVNARTEAQRNTLGRAFFNVDFVDTDSVFCNELESGQRFFDDGF